MAAVPRDFLGVWAIKSLNATPCVKLSNLNNNKSRRASNLERGGPRFEVPLLHNSAVMFSPDANSKCRHRITLFSGPVTYERV